jgi:transcriptional regulator GlxA family with amidase domain
MQPELCSHPGSQKVGFLLVPGFALLAYASAVEPLRAANRLSGQDLYQWSHISPADPVVMASCGIGINANHVAGEDGIELDWLFVVAGGNPFLFDHAPTFAWLRSMAKKGIWIGGISGGPVILARAGLLTGYQCTVHWEHVPAFRETFPTLRLTDNLYEIDGDRLTCAGATAALDMMHALLAIRHGKPLGGAVSDWFLQTQIRACTDRQRLTLRDRYDVRDAKLLMILEAIEEGDDKRLTRSYLAGLVGVSVRQLERLFRNHLGVSLTTHYKEVRLARAQQLLRQTSLSVIDIANICGFASASHFSHSYTSRYGYPPRGERALASGPPRGLAPRR